MDQGGGGRGSTVHVNVIVCLSSLKESVFISDPSASAHVDT